MNSSQTRFYIAGGTLRPDVPSYVERRADADLYDGLRQGDFCYILTSRQMGKSSLMARTAARLREEGVAVVVLDLAAIGQNLTVEQWYDGLLTQLGRHLDLEDEVEAYWLDHERQSPLQRWMRALREVALPHLGIGSRVSGIGNDPAGVTPSPPTPNTQHPIPRLVVFIDEIDAVRSLPFSTDEFFAAIRECYNLRAEDESLNRLTFCLLGVASPSDLIQDTRTTPFNIGRRIELTDFTDVEGAPLAKGLGRDERLGKALLQRVLYWTGGHPYLTQRLCQAVADETTQRRGDTETQGGADPLPVAASPRLRVLVSRQEVDRQCEKLFLSPGARERDDNLLFVRDGLLRREAERASLLDLYGKVRSGKPVSPDDTNPLLDLLRLSGIVRLTGNRLVVRNRIYERVFDGRWVVEHMPDAEARRQREAYRRGVARTAALSSVIVALFGGLAAYAFMQRNAAIRNAYVANMNAIQSDWESGNVSRILALLTETRSYGGRGFEWGYWNRLCHLDIQTLVGHTGPVLSVSFSPDGRRILTGSLDKTANIWDAQSGRETLTLTGHTGPIRSVSFSSNGRRIVTSSADRTAKVWDAAAGRDLFTLKGHTAPLSSVSFSPDGRRIVTGSRDKTAKIWDAESGRELLTLKGHTKSVSSVRFSADGRRIVTGSADNTAKVWDAQSGQEMLTLRGHTKNVLAVSFSQNSRRIVTGSDDYTARVWDAASGRETLPPLKGHSSGVTSANFSSDDRRIVTGSTDMTAKVWDAQSGRETFRIRGHLGVVTSVGFSPDGRRILTGSEDNTAKVWDAASSREALTLEGHRGDVRCVSFTRDGRRILTGSYDGTARVWDAGSGREMFQIARQARGLLSASFSPDGRRMVTASGVTDITPGSKENTVKVWNAESGRELFSLKGHTGRVNAVAFSPDGRRIVTGSEDRTAKVWDAQSGGELFTLKGHSGPVWSVRFSSDGRRIATGSRDFTAKVWDAQSGRELLLLQRHGGTVSSVSFSPDGRRILTGSWDNTAKVWDTASGRELLSLRGHTNGVHSAEFSPDAERIVTGSWDSTAKVWDAQSGRELVTLKGHTNVVWSVSFSQDGRRIVTGSGDGTAKVWFSDDSGRRTR